MMMNIGRKTTKMEVSQKSNAIWFSILSAFLLSATLVTGADVASAATDRSCFIYREDAFFEETGALADYICSDLDVVIPDDVTSIEASVFQNKNLRSVVIGKNVASIGASAFSSNELTSLVIPDSVVSIAWNAFAGNKLTNVKLGKGLVYIGPEAFRYNQLKAVVTPKAAVYVDDVPDYDAFDPGVKVADLAGNLPKKIDLGDRTYKAALVVFQMPDVVKVVQSVESGSLVKRTLTQKDIAEADVDLFRGNNAPANFDCGLNPVVGPSWLETDKTKCQFAVVKRYGWRASPKLQIVVKGYVNIGKAYEGDVLPGDITIEEVFVKMPKGTGLE